MGTYAIVDLPSEEDTYRAYRIMKEVEERLSPFLEDSEVSLLNKRAHTEWIEVSPLTYRFLEEAKRAWEKTYGYFNILHKSGASPEDILLKDGRVRFRKRAQLDPGGIGKGFALEVAFERLNLKEGFLSLAGDMKVWGHRRLLAVKNPSGGVLAEMINSKDVCLSTSGNYHKKHILQKDKDLIQITVAYKNCTLADAYATALFSMPKNLRRKFLKENPSVGVLEIYKSGDVYISGSFRRFFSFILIRSQDQF